MTQAVPVNPNSPDGIAALYFGRDDGGYCVLMTSGDVWLVVVDNSGAVVCYSSRPGIPVPVTEIKDWNRERLITRDNQLWWWTESPPAWHSGSIPCLESPIPTQKKTWGAVKGKYDDKK